MACSCKILYSLIYYACEHGIDAIDDTNISKVEREYNMVLESIHILTYIECEINTIVTTIEQLQGTSHIDVLC